MGALRKSLWTIAALAVFPAPAAAQDMCAALQRIAAAAREPVPFASLNGASGLVPGYSYCRIDIGTAARDGGVYCGSTLAPKSLMAETVGAQVRDCLGAVQLPREPFAGADDYQTETLRISVSSHCDERCHVGRIASIDLRRRREDGAPQPR